MSQRDYVLQRMYVYFGNKRKLLNEIEDVVKEVKVRLGKERLTILDGFTGSTVVARMLSGHASEIHANDMELHSYIASCCFIKQPTAEQKVRIQTHIASMNSLGNGTPGILTDMYAPQDTENIKAGERCFFTHENALRIDTWRKYVDTVEDDIKAWCLAPILTQMSNHANTMGHLKSFIKKDGIGDFGTRKRGIIPLLEVPIWREEGATGYAHNMDTNALLDTFIAEGERGATCRDGNEVPFDLIYFDPPYNQHEYGAYYFLLNVVAKNERPTNYNQLTGLVKDRNKSKYNTKSGALTAMKDLLTKSLKVSRYVLISYNDEGFISQDDWMALLSPYQYEKFEKEYKRYGSQGTMCGKGRPTVVECMYLIRGA